MNSQTIRNFLTGQGLFSALDLFFTFVFVAVLFIYSWKLTLIVLATIPLYIGISFLVRPLLLEQVKEKFNRGAESQQFLVETIVGMQTIKAASVEPIVQAQWKEKLAAYVRSAFDQTLLGSKGQGAIQYVEQVVDGRDASVRCEGGSRWRDDGRRTRRLRHDRGAGAQPILRLSQVWQDFQQIQVSVERIGDILNSPAGADADDVRATMPPPRGVIEFRNVTFRYRPGAADVLKNVSGFDQAG